MKICLIVNPRAGASRRIGAVDQALECLRRWATSIEIRETTEEGAEQLAAAIAPGMYDLVVAAGGDGTVNEVVNGIRGDTPVGILPLGTMNVLARELRIPVDDVPAACRVLQTGTPRSIDLGLCNGRRFVLMAGVGFDADAVKEVQAGIKNVVGGIAYVMSALQQLGARPPIRFRMRLDGRRVRHTGRMLLIANSRLYAGDIEIAPGASISDGYLDVCLFRQRSRLGFLAQLVGVLLRRHRQDPNFIQIKARKIELSTRPPTAVQLDGDYFGETPVEIEVLPAAVRIIQPDGAQRGG